MTTKRAQPGDLEARYARMRDLIEEAPPWHGCPVAKVVAHHTRGLARNDRAAALLVALEMLVEGATMPAEKFDAAVSLAEFAQLPPLDRAIDCAGYAIGCFIANEIAQEPQNTEPPRDALAA